MHCSKCGTKALVRDGKVIKACHCDAPIVAEMKATAKGTASVNQQS